MVNRYAARCCYCRGAVPVNGGSCWKYRGRYYVAHPACSEERKAAKKAGRAPEPAVTTFVIGGREFTQNSRGRCEDAPCLRLLQPLRTPP
jgi:hypothetical protein